MYQLYTKKNRRKKNRLRQRKKENKGLGGRGELTVKLIDELNIFYELAISADSIILWMKHIM